MNPTLGQQPDGHDHTQPTPPRHPAIPLPYAGGHPTHRRRLRGARARLLATRHARPTTVWPCAEDDRHEGAGIVSGWLHTAVVKIVTTYTRPGDRVLLLAPPNLLSGARWPGTSAAPWPGRYAGLHETAWTIVRLGRSVQTHTAADIATFRPAAPPTVPARVGLVGHAGDAFESGPGLTTDPDLRTAPSPTGSAPPDRAGRRGIDMDSDRFALIITAVYPRATDWLDATAWTDQLRPNGTLTVITHSDQIDGRLVDPTPAVVDAARRSGLAYVDHIALLEVPLRRGHPAAPESVVQDTDPSNAVRPPGPSGSTPTAWPSPVRVHSDLHVFGTVPGAVSHAARTVTPDVTVTQTQDSSDV